MAKLDKIKNMPYTSKSVSELDKTTYRYSILKEIGSLVKQVAPEGHTGKIVLDCDFNQGGIANIRVFKKEEFGI